MKKLIAVLIGVAAMAVQAVPNDNAEQLAIALIAKHEGFRATPYKCPGGHLTIGYGFADAKLVARKSMTRQEADRELGKIVRDELRFVNDRLSYLNEKQKAAVVSFIFNFGRTKFLKSDYYKSLKAGNITQAKKELKDWVHIKTIKNGKLVVSVATGLVNRRNDEARYLG